MKCQNTAFIWVAAALLLGGCKNSGNDDAPVQPNPPAVNQPPTANAGTDQIVLTGAAVALSGSGTDSDGTISTLAWTQTSGTAVTLTGAGTGTPSFTAPATAATLVFSLAVTDNAGATRNDSVTVEVNAAPLANAGGDQTVTAGANVALTGTGTDANGTVASYAWTQTAGTAVTLAGGTTAAASFTAPATAGMLVFQLTVTDNQGATSTDTVNVSVTLLAAPVIARHPADVVAYEYGIALFFVAAQGENLNYEWHYASGALWSSGPEPYMVRGRVSGGLQLSSDGDCYYVIVSNAAGSVTSEEGCLTVVDIEGDVDPAEEGGRGFMAEAYGDAMLRVSDAAVGPATGGAIPGNHSMVPRLVGPAQNCLGGGRELAATLDGVAITQPTNMPLGRHTYTQVWDACENGDPDEPTIQSGGVMIEYDFPTTFGEGTYTMYFSGHGERPLFGYSYRELNGILEVSNTRSVGGTGLLHDDIDMTLRPFFCVGPLREEPLVSPSTITLERRYDASGILITDAIFDFDVLWNDFEGDGWLGTMYADSGSSNIRLRFNPDAGDGENAYSSDDHMVVRLNGQSGDWYLGRVIAAGGVGGWRFMLDDPPPPDFPGDDD